MKTNKGEDMSATEAARKIIFQIGEQWRTSTFEKIGEIINVPKITSNQKIKLNEQLLKISLRVAKLLKVG
jgi:hypothetical protein